MKSCLTEVIFTDLKLVRYGYRYSKFNLGITRYNTRIRCYSTADTPSELRNNAKPPQWLVDPVSNDSLKTIILGEENFIEKLHRLQHYNSHRFLSVDTVNKFITDPDNIPFSFLSIPLNIWFEVASYFDTNLFASIVITTLLIRCLFVPLLIHQRRNFAKLRFVFMKTKPLKLEWLKAKYNGDYAKSRFSIERIQFLHKIHNISNYSSLIHISCIVPVQIWQTLSARYLLKIAPECLSETGLPWCENMIFPDPYFVLPVFGFLGQIGMIPIFYKKSVRAVKIAYICFCAITSFSIAFLPVSLCAIWLTSIYFTLATNYILNIDKAKNFFFIPSNLDIEPPEHLKKIIIAAVKEINNEKMKYNKAIAGERNLIFESIKNIINPKK